MFAFALIAVIALVCYGILGNSAISHAKSRVSAVANDFVTEINSPDAEVRKLTEKAQNYVLEEAVDIFLFTCDGEIVFSGYDLPQLSVENIYKTTSENLGEWQDGKQIEFGVRGENTSTTNLASCVTFNGEECILLVRYLVTQISGTISVLQLYLMIVALVTMVISFFISYTLANKLSRPLENVANTAVKLGAGDYSVEFNSAEYSEVAKLSDTLNGMKDELKRSDELQKELVANVTHDLKTPLTMIKAYALMVKEISGDDPEKRDKHLQVIIDESDRLTGLVNDILSTSKISAGLDQLNKKVINLTQLLCNVINSFSYLQDSQGYSLMVDLDENLYITADEEKIKQVIYNLISNAVNYTGEDKTVYISLKYDPKINCCRFAVRDTGSGISEEELAHIWERYYRSTDAHLRPVKGTGLGLSIVKAILNAHKFGFGVESKEGEGSTFYVDFPTTSD